MGRESSNHKAIHSSIVLLQERFRQLQRVKEMREERELLRMFSESERFSPTMYYEPSRLFFHPELILPLGSPSQVSLSLWPNSQIKHADLQGIETSLLTNFWPTDTPLVHASSIKFDDSDSDVDTSLHL